MLLIPSVQLLHKTYDLRELTIGEAIALVKMNPITHEHTISQFLSYVLMGEGNHHRLLTVQERYLLTAQYISATCLGEANFNIGENAHYADYLHMDKSLRFDNIALGFEEAWTINQLYGWQAEALETICQSWQDWIFGCMAAQLTKADDTHLPTIDTPIAAYQEWLKDRITIFKAYPERDFVELYHAFLGGLSQLTHYFELGFDSQGLVCLHKEGTGFAPARFQVSDGITQTAIFFGG